VKDVHFGPLHEVYHCVSSLSAVTLSCLKILPSCTP